jgi:hypothetical protein
LWIVLVLDQQPRVLIDLDLVHVLDGFLRDRNS